MTRYHGGKTKTAGSFAHVLQKCIDETPTINAYCEPFGGMLSVFRHLNIPENYEVILADADPDLLPLWTDLANGTFKPPPRPTEEEYKAYKLQTTPSAARTFVGHHYSFCGSKFGSFAKDYSEVSALSRLRALQHKLVPHAQNNTLRMYTSDYLQTPILNNTLIYCDPPFNGVTNLFKAKFSSKDFWQWATTMAAPELNNRVFVSEYSIPEDGSVNYTLQHTTEGNYHIRGRHVNKTLRLYQVLPPQNLKDTASHADTHLQHHPASSQSSSHDH